MTQNDTPGPHIGAPSPLLRPLGIAILASLIPAVLVARMSLWSDGRGRWHATLLDDAMISMSYARTLAGGDGLVWYPGAPRVEGITNLPWTLLMSAMHAVGLPPSLISIGVILLGSVCVYSTAYVAMRIALSFRPVCDARLLVVALAVCLNFSLIYWSLRGMEVGVVTLLTFLVVLLVSEQYRSPSTSTAVWIASASMLGVMIRPDFLTVTGAAALWVLCVCRPKRWAQVLVPLLVAPLIGLLIVTLFRLAYYGRPLPNTYYLKVAGIALQDRLARGLAVVLIAGAVSLLPAAALTIFGWRSLDAQQRRLGWLLLSVVASSAAYNVLVGGDAWEYYLIANRYLTPAAVLMAVLAVISVYVRLDTASGTESFRSPWLWLALLCISVGPLFSAACARALAALTSNYSIQIPWTASFLLPAAILVLIGLAVISVVLWLVVNRKLGRPQMRAVAFAVCLALPLVTMFRLPHTFTDDGNRFAVLGAQIGEITLSGASIAVTGAGGSQYYSDRAAVDLLGKSDREIAEGPPDESVPFNPGHNKFDYENSVRRYRPDVVAQGDFSPEFMRREGYLPMQLLSGEFSDAIRYSGRMIVWVRQDSTLVRFGDLMEVR